MPMFMVNPPSLGHSPPRPPLVRKLHPVPVTSAELRRDALSSLVPLLIRAAALAATDALRASGASCLYAGPIQGAAAWLYVLASVLLLDLLHDTYFYWAHRLLHVPFMLRHVHYLHHRSQRPTSFSGYSFHWVEAVLVFMPYPLETLLLPLHARVHRLYHLYTIVLHVGGHCGHEAAPIIPTLQWAAWRLLAALRPGMGVPRALNTVLHHDMHHRFPRVHFSLYFTVWDRWCGTLHPTYDAKSDGLGIQGCSGGAVGEVYGGGKEKEALGALCRKGAREVKVEAGPGPQPQRATRRSTRIRH